jgi:hypothetical protein
MRPARPNQVLRLLSALLAVLTMMGPVAAPAKAEMVRVPTQYIAALGEPAAMSGTGAETWGLWAVDPGPRGVWVKDFAGLVANGGNAPKGWQFDPAAWWLEEHGLIMEAPQFPLPPGQYVVTGGREATAILTVEPPDAEGHQAWALSDGASVYDVTHLRCRAALYRPVEGQACSPEKTPLQAFPMSLGVEMPSVEGCSKVDYQVLIVVGMMVAG